MNSCVTLSRPVNVSSATAGDPAGSAAEFVSAQAAATCAVQPAVLHISGMPIRLRPVVEDAMVRLVPSESGFVVPGDDPLTAQWCTRWHKDLPGDNLYALYGASQHVPAGVGCRQLITGTDSELAALRAELCQLAERYGFTVRLEAA